MLCEFFGAERGICKSRYGCKKTLKNLIDEVGKKLPAAVSDLDVYQQIVGKIFPWSKGYFHNADTYV